MFLYVKRFRSFIENSSEKECRECDAKQNEGTQNVKDVICSNLRNILIS